MKKILAFFLAALLLCGCDLNLRTPGPTLPPSPYGPEDFTYQDGFLSCTAGETVLGIDVSAHQGVIDWQAVADGGISYAIIRLGYRGITQGVLMEDSYARANLEGARAAGIRVGAYFFSQAISPEEALEEAALALEILGGTALDLPLVYDWEYVDENARTAQVDARLLTDCTKAFCQAAEAAGYGAMIYFNSYQAEKLLYLQELEQYPWWLAKYDWETPLPCKADLWQYTNTGSVPGIAGNVDVNLMFLPGPLW